MCATWTLSPFIKYQGWFSSTNPNVVLALWDPLYRHHASADILIFTTSVHTLLLFWHVYLCFLEDKKNRKKSCRDVTIPLLAFFSWSKWGKKVKDVPTLLAKFDELNKLHTNGQIPYTLDALLCHTPSDRQSHTVLLNKRTVSRRTFQPLSQSCGLSNPGVQTSCGSELEGVCLQWLTGFLGNQALYSSGHYANQHLVSSLNFKFTECWHAALRHSYFVPPWRSRHRKWKAWLPEGRRLLCEKGWGSLKEHGHGLQSSSQNQRGTQ